MFFCICTKQNIKEYQSKCSDYTGQIGDNYTGQFTSFL